ncbi:MAG: hypothetical protein ACOCO5_01205 [Segatella copri]
MKAEGLRKPQTPLKGDFPVQSPTFLEAKSHPFPAKKSVLPIQSSPSGFRIFVLARHQIQILPLC